MSPDEPSEPASSGGDPVHLIPDDGIPHAKTSECGCGPQLVTYGGTTTYRHCTPDEPVMGT